MRKVVRKGMARKCVNKLVGRVKRMYAWAVEEELLPVEMHAALVRGKGLKRGKTAARETPRVRPVDDEHVRKVLPELPAAVRAMVEVQRLCGCRPQDVVQMRPCDIDRSGGVWEFRPACHKTEHHNADDAPALDRVVYIGPQAQPSSARCCPPTPRRISSRRGTPRRPGVASDPEPGSPPAQGAGHGCSASPPR